MVILCLSVQKKGMVIIMTKTYYPKGVCSQKYEIDLEDGIIKDIRITGGCNGNLKGIAALIRGRRADEVIPLIRGTKCGMRPTSCPDQIARALEEALLEDAS